MSLALLNVSMDLLPTLRRVEYPYYFPPGGSPSFVVSSVYQTFYWQLQAQQMILPLSIMWIIIGLIIYLISNRNFIVFQSFKFKSGNNYSAFFIFTQKNI